MVLTDFDLYVSSISRNDMNLRNKTRDDIFRGNSRGSASSHGKFQPMLDKALEDLSAKDNTFKLGGF